MGIHSHCSILRHLARADPYAIANFERSDTAVLVELHQSKGNAMKKLQLIKELVQKNVQNPTVCCRVRL